MELIEPYFKSLVGRIYKILPLFEERNKGLFTYLQSLVYELHGIYYLIPSLEKKAEFTSLLATLESLSDDSLFFDQDHDVIKREVFKCISIAKKIVEDSGDPQ